MALQLGNVVGFSWKTYPHRGPSRHLPIIRGNTRAQNLKSNANNTFKVNVGEDCNIKERAFTIYYYTNSDSISVLPGMKTKIILIMYVPLKAIEEDMLHHTENIYNISCKFLRANIQL